MRAHPLLLFAGGLLLGLASGVPAADPIASGPQPGTKDKPSFIPGSFQTWLVTGPRAGRYHSPVCENGLNPTILLFVRDLGEADKPCARLVKKLDEMLAKHPDARASCSVILLNDGGFREALEKGEEDFAANLAQTAKIKDEQEVLIRELVKALEIQHVLFSLYHSAGPKEYKIHEQAQVTVLFYNKHAVLASRVFEKDKMTDADADAVFSELEKNVLEVERMSRPRAK